MRSQLPSLKDRPVKESDITRSIINWLRTQPYSFGIKHYSGGMFGTKGVADIIWCWRGRYLAIEVKTGKRNPTPDQEKFLAQVKGARGIALVARSLDDVIVRLDKRQKWITTGGKRGT